MSLWIVFSITSLYSQNQTLSKEVIRDFALNYYYKVKYENNDNLRAWAYMAGRRIGYGIVDIEIAVEKLETNTVFREELFKFIGETSRYEDEFLTLQLIGIGVKATNAKMLSQYILGKRYVKVPSENFEEAQPKVTASGKNAPKAIFKSTSKAVLDSAVVVSTRRYCDVEGLGAVYTVIIKRDSITIKYQYKDFTEIVNGVITQGKLFTNDRLERNDKNLAGKVYILQEHRLEVFNPEVGGDYTIFNECDYK